MSTYHLDYLKSLAKSIRHWILVSTTAAGSGHPTSSLSAVELMTALMFGGIFCFDADDPSHPNNDRLIFSKGHAAPLLYALWAAAGAIDEKELMTLRKFGSRLEGHPTSAFPYTEAATGSLGQGLSIGVGMAMYAKCVAKFPYKTYVLLGDGEMAEGSVWEALASAAHYKLDNLIGILDVNRLGQRGETMCGYDLAVYEKRIAAFGWKTIMVDGHSLPEIIAAYQKALHIKGQPFMIIAKTLKGKGVSFLEDKEGWHGKVLKEEELQNAFGEMGEVDITIRGTIRKPAKVKFPIFKQISISNFQTRYEAGQLVATRKAYGNALARLFPKFPTIVVLDAEVSNSTFSETFQKAYPERFFEMYIAEQNMAGVAVGLARRGAIPFLSTFAAFLSRAYDQIRMAGYSDAHIVCVGSHAGVSIGQDGVSQMGLEDIAFFRTIINGTVLYPSDAISTEKLVEEAARASGVVYIRTTRSDTPILYREDERFPIGGCKVLRKSANDQVTVVGAGITLHEALSAHEELKKEGIAVRVIDLYSIKPIDADTLLQAAQETEAIITVEDHVKEGGLGEAAQSAVGAVGKPVYKLAVSKIPKSGTSRELLDFEEISKSAIIEKVKIAVSRKP